MIEARQQPVSSQSTEVTRFNALRHGILSRYTVLPWENADDYDALLGAMVGEFQPEGPVEEHLVEELAGVIWRKRRLRLAEAAAQRRGLGRALASHRETGKAALSHTKGRADEDSALEAVRSTPDDVQAELEDIAADESVTFQALEILNSRHNDRYNAALESLREDTRAWWADVLSDRNDGGAALDAEAASEDGLRQFIEGEVLPWFEKRRRELANFPLIREQAFGEAVEPDKLERLGRYEVHLDRKLERMLAMLVRLKELRSSRLSG
jgi:hypothetical protein